MKTLLIQPDTPKTYGVGGQCAFPLGLGYIAAVLDEHHDVSVISVPAEKLSNESLRKRISSSAPEIVGITSDTLTFQRAVEIAEMVKQFNTGITVVIGGAHSNVWPSYPLKYSCFDISVYGEGERTVVELWDKLERDEYYGDVKGIAFRDRYGIIVTSKQDLIENLDELPFPARHLFPMNKYDNQYTSIGTSRGCPFACAFCSNNTVWGRRYRFRSAGSVSREIESLVNKYDTKKIYFREDLFTANKKRVVALCNEIKDKRLDIDWMCESRVNTVDKEMLIAMKAAGCELTWFGVESGSQKVLDSLNKQITLPQIRETYKLCREVGMRAGASFIIGVPGETIDDIQSTISLAAELGAEFSWFNIFTGYPTSPLYELVKRDGLYEKEVGHGILIARTEELDRHDLEEIQKCADQRVNAGVKRYAKRFLSEIKMGTLTPQKLIRGVGHLLRRS